MTPTTDAPAAQGLPLGMGLMLWVTVILAIAGYAVIGYFLHLAPLYAGFLFAWYWSSVDKVSFRLIPATMIGAAAGVGTAGLAQYAALHMGPGGGLAVLALIAAALLIQIMNWIPLVFNTAYMLFLTVTAAPLLQAGEDFGQVVAALAVGCAYFAGITWLGMNIFAKLRRAPAMVVPDA